MRSTHTALSVADITRSRAFYENCFALVCSSESAHNELNVRFVHLSDLNGRVLELFQHKDPVPLTQDRNNFQNIGIKHFAFSVGNIEETIARCLQYGGSVAQGPTEGKTVKRYAFVRDPDGIPVEIFEE